MYKKPSVLFLLLFIANFSIAQEIKKETLTIETKMDKFSSKTGAITKFIDVKLPNLKTSYSSAETRVRKVLSGSLTVYFFQIEKAGQYSTSTASIEYSDLLEVIKALNSLKIEVDKDIAINPDYLENKFITVDGFQLGYYVEKGKSKWYIKLEKYGTDNTLFISDELTIEDAFIGAKNKIEELKK